MSLSIINIWKKDFAELLQLPIITTDDGFIVVLEYRNKNNKLHRNINLGPALIGYYETGQISYTRCLAYNKYGRPKYY